MSASRQAFGETAFLAVMLRQYKIVLICCNVIAATSSAGPSLNQAVDETKPSAENEPTTAHISGGDESTQAFLTK